MRMYRWLTADQRLVRRLRGVAARTRTRRAVIARGVQLLDLIGVVTLITLIMVPIIIVAWRAY